MSRSRSWQKSLGLRVEIKKLMTLAKEQPSEIEINRHFSDQENCLRLVIVALIGHFQSYVADLLNELCDTLPAAWQADMPLYQKKYILVQLHRRLNYLLENTDENSLTTDSDIEKLRSSLIDCTGWLNSPIAVASSRFKEDLRGFLKDNGSKALDRAISQLGGGQLKFSNWLDSTHPQYRGIFGLLDNAIEIRNDVAHGKIDRRVTLREARTYIIAVYRLMLKADEYLAVNTVAPQANAAPPSLISLPS